MGGDIDIIKCCLSVKDINKNIKDEVIISQQIIITITRIRKKSRVILKTKITKSKISINIDIILHFYF